MGKGDGACGHRRRRPCWTMNTQLQLNLILLSLILIVIADAKHQQQRYNKKCIQPVKQRIWDPICYEAVVPTTIHAAPTSYNFLLEDYFHQSMLLANKKTNIKHKKSCLSTSSSSVCADKNDHRNLDPQQQQTSKEQEGTAQEGTTNGIDVCSFIAKAIYADFTIFDIVLLNQGTCGSNIDILAGTNFDHTHVSKLLPYRNELVILRLLGSDIVDALKSGLQTAIFGGKVGAFPKTFGISYDWDFSFKNKSSNSENTTSESSKTKLSSSSASQSKSSLIHITNPKILIGGGKDHICNSIPLLDDEYYSVLTNSYLAEGNDGYQILSKPNGPLQNIALPTATGVSETDSFWFHVHTTCNVTTSWKTIQTREEEIAKSGVSMIYLVPGQGYYENQTMY